MINGRAQSRARARAFEFFSKGLDLTQRVGAGRDRVAFLCDILEHDLTLHSAAAASHDFERSSYSL